MQPGKILREPLVHFLVIGLGFFVLFNVVSDDKMQVDDQKIVVDEPALLEFMQFQAKAFDAGYFTNQLASLTVKEKQQLIDAYIREEVLYREAKNLGMELNDNLIRRRMVGKIEYLTHSMASPLVNESQAQLQELYQQRKDEYYIEPSITFTHVFFDTEKHGLIKAQALAESQLDEFISKSMPAFTDAAKYSDRFPYHINYVKRSRSFIASHFGDSFAQALFSGETNNQNWFGPIRSAYGYHLILMLEKTEGHYLPIEEVLEELSEEFKRQQILELQNQAIQALISGYQIIIDLPVVETR